MLWQEMLLSLDSPGIVEFGIHQMDLKSATPKWRRHKGGPQTRFISQRSALFSPDKGARVACLGKSSYAKKVYSAGLNSIVPYVAVWLRGNQNVFLVRASAAEPEVKVKVRDPDYRPVAGTILTRDYQGKEYRVIATADGNFDFEGRTYNSLSHIAREITGTRWSGPLFFGLKTRAGAKSPSKRGAMK